MIDPQESSPIGTASGPVAWHATWLAARARNAVHRPQFIGAVSAGVLVATLVAFLVMPQEKRRAQSAVQLPAVVKIDTLPMAAAIGLDGRRAATAESALVVARASATAAAAMVKATVDTLDPAMIARRDSLTNVVNALGTLLATAETAPLPSSYRALASSSALAGNGRVKALLDTLGEVEQERDAMGAGGGADPVFVALTSRLTDLGRAIQAVGDDRRVALKEQLSAVAPSAPTHPVAKPVVLDTAQWIAERDSARSTMSAARDELTNARNQMVDQQKELDHARAAAAAIAPPFALIGVAIVFGVVFGFGTALVGELRRPRLADAAEVERVSGARAIATVRPTPPAPDRTRREADRSLPWFVEPLASAHQLTYLRVARNAASHVMVTVVADEPMVAAFIAINLAAIATDEARTALVIDADTSQGSVATALEMSPQAGTADVVAGRAEWSFVTTTVTLGRGRIVDVVPAGVGQIAADALPELFRTEGVRLARHYDALLLVATPDQAIAGLPAALPVADTILCVRAGHTRIADLKARIEALGASGAHLLGVVVWDAPVPRSRVAARAPKALPPSRPAKVRALVDAP